MTPRLPLSLRTRTWLYQITPQTAQRPLWDPLTRWSKSGAVERRRYLASIASEVEVNNPLLQQSPVIEDSALDLLLASIRRQDVGGTTSAFFAWTEDLADTESPRHHDAVQQLENLPSPVLSEIFRSLDPVSNPDVDVAYGLNITQGQTQFTDQGKLVDDFGARLHHLRVLSGIEAIISHRAENSRFPLLVPDFEVFLRVAGAASEFVWAPRMFARMKEFGQDERRTRRTWTEFLKARFKTCPTYYQYDRNRVVVDANSLINVDDVVKQRTPEDAQEPEGYLERLSELRYAAGAFKLRPWDRRRTDPAIDQTRSLRRWEPSDYRSFWSHWNRLHKRPQGMDVELLSVAIEGFSRANDSIAIFENVLAVYYDIRFDEETQTITGGVDLSESSPLFPTDRLLFAIVEAFGAMSQISLGMQLVDFISRKYSVPISSATWSNLLNWTYVNATKLLRVKRRAYGEDRKRHLSPKDVALVWNTMTADPYNIKPSFEDLDIYLKCLIKSRNFKEAVELIRESAMPFYQSVNEEYETSVLDELLLMDAANDAPTPTTRAALTTASHRRKQAEAEKDFIFHRISYWFASILKGASSSAAHRSGSFTKVVIPQLIGEYPNFFPRHVRYRTVSGEVSFVCDNDCFFKLQDEYRTTLPQKKSGIAVLPFHRDHLGVRRMVVNEETGAWMVNPKFQWPTTKQLLVYGKARIPPQRAAELTRPPSLDVWSRDAYRWLLNLEVELVR